MVSTSSNELGINVNNFCSHYSIDSFNNLNLNHNMFIIHQNIRSFNCNGDDFLLFLNNLSRSPSVIVLSETWFSENNFHDIDGYLSYHTFRSLGDRGGGISIYVNKCFKSVGIPSLSFISEAGEFCTVKINIQNNQSLYILGFYRPPACDTTLFCNTLGDVILTNFGANDKILAAGDANINLFNNNSITEAYFDVLQSRGLLPYISLPTRVTNSGSSLIDHIWGSIFSEVTAGVFHTDISDHKTIFISLKINVSPNDNIFKTFRDHSERCLHELRGMMSEFEIYSSLNVDVRTRIFFLNIFELYDKN